MNAAIEARGLTRTFDGSGQVTRAVTGVDLAVAAGEFVSVMGPSGCGKSTLLHLLGGLDSPTSGEVVVLGERLHDRSVAQRARFRRSRIGFVFQEYNLVPNLSVLDNVLLPAQLDGRRDAVTRARDLLERLGLTARADHAPGALSGGERQRAAIARAMINEPAIILADEPTGALDSRATGTVLQQLREINGDGIAIVVVTHDARVATNADRLITMRDGAVVEETRLDHVGGTSFAGLLGPEVDA